MARKPPKRQPFKGPAINRNEIERVKVPTYGSIKVDGLRGGVWASTTGCGDMLLTNSMLPFPNKHLNADFMALHDDGRRVLGLDFELTVCDLHDPNCYRKSESVLMSENGLPADEDGGKFIVWVFDLHIEDLITRGVDYTFEDRQNAINASRDYFKGLNAFCKHTEFRILEQHLFTTHDEVRSFGDDCVALGHEGAIFTDPDSPYKYGRSTESQGYRWKYKPYEDAEAVVVEFIQGETNTNAATKDAKGNTKRSSAKAGKKPNGILGTIVAKDIKTGIEFRIASFANVSQSTKKTMWSEWLRDPDQFKGRMFVYKYLNCGGYDSRRHATFKWWRDERDMTE